MNTTPYRIALAAVGIAALSLSATVARADVLPDPLHGFCNGTGSGSCIDNGTNTPLGNSTEFGFYMSPGSKTGTSGILTLDILLPDNLSQPASFSVTGVNGYPSGTLMEVSTTPWNSGTLAAYLSVNATPDNPIGAFLPTTQTFQSSADGFFVYQVDLGTVKLFKAADQALEFDTISGLGLGSYVVGFFNTGTADMPACPGGPPGDECATANSGALLVNGNTPPIPEPGTLALLATALGGLGFLGRRFRRKS